MSCERNVGLLIAMALIAVHPPIATASLRTALLPKRTGRYSLNTVHYVWRA